MLESIAKWIHYERKGGKNDIVYCSDDPCADAETTEELLDCLAKYEEVGEEVSEDPCSGLTSQEFLDCLAGQ